MEKDGASTGLSTAELLELDAAIVVGIGIHQFGERLVLVNHTTLHVLGPLGCQDNDGNHKHGNRACGNAVISPHGLKGPGEWTPKVVSLIRRTQVITFWLLLDAQFGSVCRFHVALHCHVVLPLLPHGPMNGCAGAGET